MENFLALLARLWPLAYVIGGLLVGVTVDRLVILRLSKFVRRRWTAMHPGLESFRIAAAVWIVLFSAYLAVLAFAPPPQTLEFVRNLLLAIALASATLVAGRIVFGLVANYSHSASGILPSSSLISSLAELLVFIVGGLIVLGSLGISITPLLTALGVGGLAVALALKDPLANLFAGLQIIASRQLRPGDYVKFDGGVEGTIVDITWNTTTIRDRSESLIVIPNAKVAASSFTNYDLPHSGLTIEVKARVSGDSDLNEAERVIVEVANETINACSAKPRFEPYVRFLELTDTRVEFAAFLCVDRFIDQFKVRHEFVKRLQGRFRSDPRAVPILNG